MICILKIKILFGTFYALRHIMTDIDYSGMQLPNQLLNAGWREWVALPQLGINGIKAKLDTGARTSSLHAFRLQPFKERGRHKIAFAMHPIQENYDYIKECVADIQDYRWVCDSGGHEEQRYVIITQLKMAEYYWPIEVTLSNRDNMLFRMLIGRTAMKDKLIINPSDSFLTGNKHQLLLDDN